MTTIYIDLIEEPYRKQRKGESHEEYCHYIDRFQPFRWIARSGDNQKKLARSSERYFSEQKCRHAIDLLFGPNSNVFLRKAGEDDVRLRSVE